MVAVLVVGFLGALLIAAGVSSNEVWLTGTGVLLIIAPFVGYAERRRSLKG